MTLSRSVSCPSANPRCVTIAVPWFGSDFTCASATSCDELVWSAHDPAWFGGQCGQALDGGPSLGQALAIFSNRSSLGHSLSSELSWDAPSATNYFEWRNTTKNHSGVADGHRHQLWFDDNRSFGLKASMAIETLGLRGIGIWLPELAATAEQAEQMWGAVPLGRPSTKTDDRQAARTSAVTITGHIDDAGSPAPNVFSTLTSWSPETYASPAPAGLSDIYPFLKYIELFTATGGCFVGFPGCAVTRDLLNDPARGLASGINVTNLLPPLRNIVAAGFKP